MQSRTPTDELEEIIEHAAHLLPAQGPITAFVHHNTLHAFEELPFDEAVAVAAHTFGCQPYLPETEFRHLLESGRIAEHDLREALLDEMGDTADMLIGRLGTRYRLRLAMLQHPLQMGSPHELQWFIAESDALRRFRAEAPAAVRRRMIADTRHWVMRDLVGGEETPSGKPSVDPGIGRVAAQLIHQFGPSRIDTWRDDVWEVVCLQLLWHVCSRGSCDLPRNPTAPPATVRPRDQLVQVTGVDTDELVHGLLIRLCAAYLDQGTATWPMPHREEGFYQAFLALYSQPGGPPDRWLSGLRRELQRLRDAQVQPLQSILESLQLLGIEEHRREAFIAETLLALRGWAGMFHQVDVRPDRVAHLPRPGCLIEYLAVRLILERLAIAHVAGQTLGLRGAWNEMRGTLGFESQKNELAERRAFWVFQLAQIQAWTPQELQHLSRAEWRNLVQEIESFPSLDRRRLFQQAYERRYRSEALDAMIIHAQGAVPPRCPPRFQVVCCLDEREESFRRHLEEIAPDCETLGTAGHFEIAMHYQGAGEAHFQPLCPAVIRPVHYVREVVVDRYEEIHRRRAKTRRMIGNASHQVHVGTRSFIGGALLAILGTLASVALVARVLSPRLTARLRRKAGRFVRLPPATQLELQRTQPEPSPEPGHIGFTVPEMADIVERLLQALGVTSHLAPLVVVQGHGSSSLNNPHEAAHDCGACGGARGGPNARAFAQMANDPRVRRLLAEEGRPTIPEEVVFVGAYHNTCDDSVTYFDVERIPPDHQALFDEVRRNIDLARERSAHERSRRFESAPLDLPTDAALRHVEGRAEDLAQTRPEYGHATNALCLVGPRWRSRNLFLDRRAFLTSYEPHQDDEDASVLDRILQAVIPVCAGISLEYYFSFVDSTGYGCGTKLPHNVTSLLGVMDGAASDLRPGLPWQMVEIHEPVRLLLVIETTPERMLAIMNRNPPIARLCRNAWVQLAVQDPSGTDIFIFREGAFEPYRKQTDQLPVVKTSLEWYRGWRGHLGFAAIEANTPSAAKAGAPAQGRDGVHA